MEPEVATKLETAVVVENPFGEWMGLDESIVRQKSGVEACFTAREVLKRNPPGTLDEADEKVKDILAVAGRIEGAPITGDEAVKIGQEQVNLRTWQEFNPKKWQLMVDQAIAMQRDWMAKMGVSIEKQQSFEDHTRGVLTLAQEFDPDNVLAQVAVIFHDPPGKYTTIRDGENVIQVTMLAEHEWMGLPQQELWVKQMLEAMEIREESLEPCLKAIMKAMTAHGTGEFPQLTALMIASDKTPSDLSRLSQNKRTLELWGGLCRISTRAVVGAEHDPVARVIDIVGSADLAIGMLRLSIQKYVAEMNPAMFKDYVDKKNLGGFVDYLMASLASNEAGMSERVKWGELPEIKRMVVEVFGKFFGAGSEMGDQMRLLEAGFSNGTMTQRSAFELVGAAFRAVALPDEIDTEKRRQIAAGWETLKQKSPLFTQGWQLMKEVEGKIKG